MIDNSFLPRHPGIVPAELYHHHLGLPVDEPLSPAMETLAQRAKVEFEECSEPWGITCDVPIAQIDEDVVRLTNGRALSSRLIADGLRAADAEAIMVTGFTAGRGVDRAIAEHWAERRPDEAMFLNSYAAAFMEYWRDLEAERQQASAAERGRELLPRYSPGYDGWDLADQRVLFELIESTNTYRDSARAPIELLDSGCLQPAKATLSMQGVTRPGKVNPTGDWWAMIASRNSQQAFADSPSVKYSLPVKALRKWAAQRLTINHLANRHLVATFRFSGTTCVNMGTPFEFEFRIRACREATGAYRILECNAAPAEADRGHRAMCAYLADRDAFLSAVASMALPVDRTLDEMIQWSPDTNPAGCLCTAASQNHKWRIVLQTLHYALLNDTETKNTNA